MLLQADAQMCSDSHQLNQLLTSHANANLVAATPDAGFEGTIIPRVRARHGQATDPHSIAERVRNYSTSYVGAYTESGKKHMI
jgi:hypothetical protein